MLKRYVKLLFPAVFIVFLMVFTGCYMVPEGVSTVVPVIRVIDAPTVSDIDSVVLSITGPDMDPVSVTYSTLPDKINISVPEGSDRTFTLDINMSSDSPGTVKSFRGTGTANLSSDSAEVILDMGIGNTKIIVPDAANNRLVQIPDISGSIWNVLDGDSISNPITNTPLGTNFLPWDVDFDENGVFYVANNYYDNSNGYVYIFFDITYTQPSVVLTSPNGGFLAVAVDRVNNILYGVDSGLNVYYAGINGETVAGSFTDLGTDFYGVTGIAVDDKGYVYIAGLSTNSDFLVQKYGKEMAGGVLDSFNSAGDPSAGDCVIYDGYLYVTVDDSNVYRFDPDDFDNGGAYITLKDVPNISASFNRPCSFLATMNDHLTIVDDDGTTKRLISVDGLDGSGYATFGSSGTGEGEFMFYDDGSNSFYSGGY